MKTSIALHDRVASAIVNSTNAKFLSCISDPSENSVNLTDVEECQSNDLLKNEFPLFILEYGNYGSLPDTASFILNQKFCPVLLLKENKTLKRVKRIAYATDLRFCDLSLVKYLIQLARPYEAEVLLIHVSAEGVPDLDNDYAEKIFKQELLPSIHYSRVDFINIKGEAVTEDMEIICEVLQVDILVVVNRKQGCYERLFPHASGVKNYRIQALLLYPKF